jgi:hypothetical protein
MVQFDRLIQNVRADLQEQWIMVRQPTRGDKVPDLHAMLPRAISSDKSMLVPERMGA